MVKMEVKAEPKDSDMLALATIEGRIVVKI